MVTIDRLDEITPPGMDGRRWRVTYTFRAASHATTASLGGREEASTPRGWSPIDRAFTEPERREAARLAIERRILGGELPGEADDVTVTAFDLYEAAGR